MRLTGNPSNYAELRSLAFRRGPKKCGLRLPPGRHVWGGLMELGMPVGTATLACLLDGNASLYLSSGGGVIGGLSRDAMVGTVDRFMSVLMHDVGLLTPAPANLLPHPPTEGWVQFVAYVDGQPPAAAIRSDDALKAGDVLAPLFAAGHAVIAQLRVHIGG